MHGTEQRRRGQTARTPAQHSPDLDVLGCLFMALSSSTVFLRKQQEGVNIVPNVGLIVLKPPGGGAEALGPKRRPTIHRFAGSIQAGMSLQAGVPSAGRSWKKTATSAG